MSISSTPGNSTIKEQLARYFHIFSWIMKDSVWRYKKDVAVVLVTEFLGMSANISAVGFTIFYAKAVQSGNVVERFGYSFDPRTSFELLLIVALYVVFALFASAALVYFSDFRKLKLRRKHHQFCSARILNHMSKIMLFRSPDGRTLEQSNIRKLASIDSKGMGKVLFLFTGIIVPIITAIVAVSLLFYYSVSLTILIGIIMTVFVSYMYRVNLKSAKSTLERERFSKLMSGELRGILFRIYSTPRPLPDEGKWLQEDLFDSGATAKFFDAYEWRLRAPMASTFINNVFFSVALFAILIAMGSRIISTGAGWDTLVIYVVALRYALISIKSVTVKMTAINRFYPWLKRYLAFLNLPVASADDRIRGALEVSARSEPMEGSMINCVPGPEEVTGIISPLEPARYNLSTIMERLFWNRPELASGMLASMWFNNSPAGLLPLTIRESVGFPAGYGIEELKGDLQRSGLGEFVDPQVLESFEMQVRQNKWGDFDAKSLVVIGLISSFYTDKEYVFIDEHTLRALKEEHMAHVLDRLSGKTVFIVHYGNLGNAGNYDEKRYVVLGEDSVIGIGDMGWLEGVRKELVANPVMNMKARFPGGEDDIDDDFEEEELEEEG